MSASPLKAVGQKPPRPSKLQTSKSFTRFEPGQQRSPHRSWASTLSHATLPPLVDDSDDTDREVVNQGDVDRRESNASVFEKLQEEDDVETPRDSTVTSPTDLPADFDELPIEIASWIDRFANELKSAKVFAQPPSADQLSDIFQDFYVKAEQKIGMQIKMLASKQSRAASPAPPPLQARSSVRPRPSPRLGSSTSKDSLRRTDSAAGGQPMLTPIEVHERRKARRLLEYKRVALEEAAERRLCEALYDKLWRHRSTLDDVRDEKLRGKTGALQLVGIGLKELGIDLVSSKDPNSNSAERAVLVEEWISKAAEGLLQMNEPQNPKGKLDSLIAAHQKIVDLLTKVHQGSSSADEILPTLIYCLIVSPPDGLNIVSNMTFIQRFRAANKMNGEAAYCLTNLEAAITFVETVDLASLRSEESAKDTSAIASQPTTPMTAKFTPTQPMNGSTAPPTTATSQLTALPDTDQSSLKMEATKPARKSHHRRLSSLMGMPTALTAANDAVRNTAEESFKTVSTTLDSSFKFLFGKLKEQQVDSPDGDKAVVLPKTLEEAKQLMTPKPAFDEDGNVSEGSSFQEADDDHPLKVTTNADDDETGLLDLIAGRSTKTQAAKQQHRDRSVDSRASGKASGLASQVGTPPIPGSGTQALDTAAEAFRTFGSSINPLNRLSGAGFMRGFGRSPTPQNGEAIASPPPPTEMKDTPEATLKAQANAEEKQMEPDRLIPGPRQRFVDTRQANELKLGEVQDLLNEYHRLVEYLKKNGLA